MVLRATPLPGPVRGTAASGGGSSSKFAEMTLEDRFFSALHRTLPKLPADLQDEFKAMLAPEAIAIVVGVLVVWAGSHYVGVGFVVDALLLIGGVIFLGWEIWKAGADFVAFLDLTYNAQSEADLEAAARHLSNFISVVGVAAFVALLTRGAGKKINVKAARARKIAKVGTAADAGMTPGHFQAILKVAMDPSNPRVILFRRTNPKSVPYIQRGFPAKPAAIKANTDSATGIVTCSQKPGKTVADVRNTLDPVSGKKYYTVDKNRKTATNGNGDTIDLSETWKGDEVRVDQVIDPSTKKPLVGDYDLFDVFDPQVLKGTQPGNHANLVLATKDGQPVKNFTNPVVRKTIEDINKAIGTPQSPRVMHGHHGAYGSIENLDADELVTAFMPDGTAITFNKSGLDFFYKNLGRSTLDLAEKLGLKD